MNGLVILIVVITLVGIILLGGRSPLNIKTRERFLQELTDFLEGTLEPIAEEDYENSYRIKFQYDGEECVFEDIEKKGFKDKVYVAYLKINTPSKLTLTFTEKQHSMKIRSEIFIASEVSTQQIERQIKLQIPDYLKDLNVTANDPALANELFEDKKVAGVFKKLKNMDARGSSFLAIGVIDGVTIMEFYSLNAYNPNLSALRNDVASIEDNLGDVMVIVHKLKQMLK